VSICVGLDRPVLALLDPHTLQTLAAMPLPIRNVTSGSNPFTDFSGGGYFYLDDQDRAVLPTNDRHLLVVGETPAPGFQVSRDYDLSGAVPPGDAIESALPDWSGRFWFVTRQGMVGTVDRASGFVVSDKALYRFDAGSGGEPKVTWRAVYPNSGIRKPGQSDAGSGTTPTLMGKDWVAITDNADPMDVVVYDRSASVDSVKQTSKKGKGKKKRKRARRRNQAKQRLVCSEPVFRQGASSTDQSLIATDSSIVAENNYGYSGIAATMNGGVTEPGLTRVDVVSSSSKAKTKKKTRKRKKRKGRGAPAVSYSCRTAWTSDERAPSVVPKLSLANGLVYTYTKPPRSDSVDAWYLTALDFRSGRTVYRRLAGTGFGFNNNYAPVTLGPDGTAYVGVLGGLVEFP
jgi:hypothetical protein